MNKDKYDKDYDVIMATYYRILAVNLLLVMGFVFVVYKVGAFFGIW